MGTIVKRRRADGALVYQAKVRLRGTPPDSATFAKRADAKKWIAATETKIRDGRYFGNHEAKKRTLADAIDRYIESELPKKPKVQAMFRRQLNWWRSELGHLRLADLTPALIAEKRDKLAKRKTKRETLIAPATVNRFLVALSSLLSTAESEWQWLEQSPMRKVKKLKEAKPRDRYLKKGEIKRLLVACEASSCEHLYPITVFALATGARRSEITSLKWADVDTEVGRLTFTDTKNGETRSVALTGDSLELLRNLKKHRSVVSHYVFPSGKNPQKPVAFQHAWQKALKEAKISDFRFHDLRHTTASYLAMQGISPLEIADLLGHKTLDMVKRYSHLAHDHKASVGKKAQDAIFG